MRLFLASLKAVAAGLSVFIADGAITGHWATDAHIGIAVIGAIVTWVTPNVGYPYRRGTANVQTTTSPPAA